MPFIALGLYRWGPSLERLFAMGRIPQAWVGRKVTRVSPRSASRNARGPGSRANGKSGIEMTLAAGKLMAEPNVLFGMP